MNRLTVIILIFLFTLSLFAQHKGKIVFSKSPVNVENPANLKSEFNSGDYIYGAAYFKKPIKKMCKGKISNNAAKQSVEIKVYKNGVYANSMNATPIQIFHGKNLGNTKHIFFVIPRSMV